MTRPLGSTRVTGHRRYYEAVRPCAPRRYAAPAGLLLGDLPLPADGQTDPPACRGDRFPCSTQEPEPRSRHLHAGHHLASQQAPARLIPEQLLDPGFDVIQAVSTPHQWFASARLRDSHLTRSRRAVSATLTTPALDRRSLRWFAASPCRAATGGPPPSLMQHRSRAVFATSKPSFTFMAHRNHRPRSRRPAGAGTTASSSGHPEAPGQCHGRAESCGSSWPTPASQGATARRGSAGSPTADSCGLPATSCCTSSETGGRPLAVDGYVQRRATMRRCQRSSVSGCTRTPTSPPVGADGSAPQAAPGRWAVGEAEDAGGGAPQARGVTPESQSPWPLPTDSRAGPARGCGAAPGRRTTKPHRPPSRKTRIEDAS
jgi:hypothetical protein